MSTDVTVFNEDGREKEFNVTIKEARVLKFSWVKLAKPIIEKSHQDCVQALDIILRSASANNSVAVSICLKINR